jgi:hypothetical protein
MNRSIFANSLFSTKKPELFSKKEETYSQTLSSSLSQEVEETRNSLKNKKHEQEIAKKRRASQIDNNYDFSSESDSDEKFNSEEEFVLEDKNVNQICALLKKEQYRLSLSSAKQNILNERLKYQIDKASKATKRILKCLKFIDEKSMQPVKPHSTPRSII